MVPNMPEMKNKIVTNIKQVDTNCAETRKEPQALVVKGFRILISLKSPQNSCKF